MRVIIPAVWLLGAFPLAAGLMSHTGGQLVLAFVAGAGAVALGILGPTAGTTSGRRLSTWRAAQAFLMGLSVGAAAAAGLSG